MTEPMSLQTRDLHNKPGFTVYSRRLQPLQNHILARCDGTTPLESHPCEKTPGGGGPLPQGARVRLPLPRFGVGSNSARLGVLGVSALDSSSRSVAPHRRRKMVRHLAIL